VWGWWGGQKNLRNQALKTSQNVDFFPQNQDGQNPEFSARPQCPKITRISAVPDPNLLQLESEAMINTDDAPSHRCADATAVRTENFILAMNSSFSDDAAPISSSN
jgi:hypothetical protein